jgi:hypothetical protein
MATGGLPPNIPMTWVSQGIERFFSMMTLSPAIRWSRWDNVFHRANLLVTEVPEHVHRGRRALEFRVPRQQTEVANAVIKRLDGGHDRVFLRYYSRFDPAFDQTGSSHNGGFPRAIAPGVPFATPGMRADGHNKFMASFENWRGDQQDPPPGKLNVYLAHSKTSRDPWATENVSRPGSCLHFEM